MLKETQRSHAIREAVRCLMTESEHKIAVPTEDRLKNSKYATNVIEKSLLDRIRGKTICS